MGSLLYLGVYLSPSHTSPPDNWHQLEVRVSEWADLLQWLSSHGRMLVINQVVLFMIWHCFKPLAMFLELLASLQR